MGSKDKILVMETAWVLADQLWKVTKRRSWLTWLIEMYVRPTDKVLDLGCGDGYATKVVPCSEMMGIDIWEPVKGLYHSKFILGDIKNVLELIDGQTFDVVLCLDALEHLESEDAEKLLKDIDKISTDVSMIFTPAEFENNKRAEDKDCWAYGNDYNDHHSLWTVDDLKAHGYDAYRPVLPSGVDRGDYVVAVKDQRDK